MDISFVWYASEVAGISRIECDCEQVYDYSDDNLVVYQDSTWFCDECNKEIEFRWVGMTYK